MHRINAVFIAVLLSIYAYESSAEVYYFDNDQHAVTYLTANITTGGDLSKEEALDILSIVLSYKAWCVGLDKKDDKIYLIMNNGNRLIYDEKKIKTYEEKLDKSDIKNMLEQMYEPGLVFKQPETNMDPGRFRASSLLDIIYGETNEIVKNNCERVTFCNTNILFNKNNGASAALKSVWHDLGLLIKDNPAIYDYVCPIAGTLASRNIEGTKRKSPHYYGIAIDLNTRNTHYWRWSKNRKVVFESLKKYPISIMKIFEANGFIWGGKWDHYDTMHFEYRPELIKKYELNKKYTVR